MNWGLVGASSIAAQHVVPAIRRAGGTIRAVHSHSAEHGARFARAHGIPVATTSLEELLKDRGVQAVYVSSVNALHAEQVEQAAAAGRHVLCDKPLATSEEDAAAMVAACRAAGVVLAVNHQSREKPVLREMRRMLRAGDIGELRAVHVAFATELPQVLRTWRLDDRAPGGGVVLDLTVHSADLVRFLVDDEFATVSALAGHALGPSTESEAVTAFRLARGTLGVLHESFTVPHAGTTAALHGSLGSLVASDVLLPTTPGRLHLRRGSGSRRVVPDGHHDPYVGVIHAFTAAVEDGGAPSASGEDGLEAVRTALAVLESAATGRAVELRPGAAA